jgi:heme/copper-type cytochrome/quinol oxidase subunit 1
MFVIGGLGHLPLRRCPSTSHQDTYFIVAYIHYVVFGGRSSEAPAVIAFPGRCSAADERRARPSALLAAPVFFNLTFFLMPSSAFSQMRRNYNLTQYEFLQHQQHWNVFITYSAPFRCGVADSVRQLFGSLPPAKGAMNPAKLEHAGGRRRRRRRT